MKRSTVRYFSIDEQEFNSAEECRAHESKVIFEQLVGLTIDDVRAGIGGSNEKVRHAMRQAGMAIQKDRVAKGDVRKRTSKGGVVTAKEGTSGDKAPAAAPFDTSRPADEDPANQTLRDELAQMEAEAEAEQKADAEQKAEAEQEAEHAQGKKHNRKR